MILSVLAFGKVRDIIGASIIEIECNGCTLEALKTALEQREPLLKGTTFIIAVNHQYATDSTILSPDDEIALIPHIRTA